MHALSKVFRGKFMQALHQAGDAGALARDPAAACAMPPHRLRRRWAISALPGSSMQRASALPETAAETYTAHSTASPAVQSNEVYPPPCTTVPSISFGSASDKRYSLGVA